MTYNLSSIMRRAWEIVRSKFGGFVTRSTLRLALKDAWKEAKDALKRATESEEVRRLKDAILCIECKSRLSEADYAEMKRLRSELVTAEKRTLIESAKGRFVSVVFTKKDGSLREMRVQPAKLKFHVKGEAASEAAQRAVETRKTRHPHLCCPCGTWRPLHPAPSISPPSAGSPLMRPCTNTASKISTSIWRPQP